MNPLYTHDHFRLTFIKSSPGYPFNWLFLPGESLNELTAALQVTGTVWHVDYPGDGSNRGRETPDYGNWSAGLEGLIQSLNHDGCNKARTLYGV
jgi:hypothetical protein